MKKFFNQLNKISKLVIVTKIFVLLLGKNIFLKILKALEIRVAFLQGKGFGSLTTKLEFEGVSSLLNNINIAIDIGSHRGLYIYEILKKFPNCEVHAFEASKVNFECLKKKYNNFTNVKLNHKAVSNQNSETILYSDFEGSVLASLAKRNLRHLSKEFNYTEKVNMTRLDTYIDQIKIKKVDFIKIDVEGYEINVLEGLGNKIYSIKCIQFEFGSCNLDTKINFHQLYYWFKDKKFLIFRITPFGLYEIKEYHEVDEFYSTTNFIALNKN